jgi:uncharacterized protein (DUF1697 family)
MQKYVALLRGINVGGNKKVPMAELKKVLEKSGLINVKTLLASGNVVFSQRDGFPESNSNILQLQRLIPSIIEKEFGFPVPVLLRTHKEIEKIIELNPFKEIKVTPQIRLYVTFLFENPEKKSTASYISKDESFKIILLSDKTVFSVLDLSISNTPEAMNMLEKIYGKNITTRNWNTILKIANL